MKIKFFITGGTIDKSYNKFSGELGFAGSNIGVMLKKARHTLNIETEILFLKDSLDMTEVDRQKLLNKCLYATDDKIVISHGTDTMVKTAKLLGDNIANKTIILFGSMIPYIIDNSDAFFNLGVALSCVQKVPSGVYIAMNGMVFDYKNVEKNKKLCLFTELKN